MTVIPIPDDMTGGTSRKPGDFRRNHMGAPIVTRPDDPTKSTIYGRPSGFGSNLENPFNLIRWKERQLVRGLGCDWTEEEMVGIPYMDDSQVDGIVARAYAAAGTHLAADRGTHVHLLTEWVDRHDEAVSGDLVVKGIELGLPSPLQIRIVHQWRAFRAELGVEAVAVEQTIVNDELRLAGTCDRLDRTTRQIDTNLGPLNGAFIGDIKTGSLTANDDGSPRYWIKYPIQLVAYRDGFPYDTNTETRGEWPEVPHTRIALIYHYDLARALDGEPVDWQAIPVDLNVGRIGAQIALKAKQWVKRRDMFAPPIETAAGGSIPQPQRDMAATPEPPAAHQEEPCQSQVATASTTTISPEAATSISCETATADSEFVGANPKVDSARAATLATSSSSCQSILRRRVQNLIDAGHEQVMRARWPEGVPTLGHELTADQLDTLTRAVERAEADAGMPFDPEPQPQIERSAPPAGTPYTPPPEGELVGEAELDALRRALNDLPPAIKADIAQIGIEANGAGRPIGLGGGMHTLRRWSIARALVAWGVEWAPWAASEIILIDLWKKTTSVATPDQTADPDTTLGALLGSFTIEQANALHESLTEQSAA